MRVKACLDHAANLLGIPGIMGIGLLLFSLGLYGSAIRPAGQKVTKMTATVASVVGTTPRQEARNGSAYSLSDFYAFFPVQERLPEWLGKVYGLAEAEGLDLPLGQYRMQRDSAPRIVSYEAVFPVRGAYPQVRRFLAAVLNELPFVSLDDLRLERQHAADPTIQAQIRMTFHLRVNQGRPTQ